MSICCEIETESAHRCNGRPSPGAGFSEADPDRFYLPLVTDPAYAPAVVNVEAQQGDPESLLHWVRALLAARRRQPVFGTGDFTLIDTGDPAVLGYRRTDDEADITVLANFATATRGCRP